MHNYSKLYKGLLIITALVISFFYAAELSACEIEIDVVGKKKEFYSPGDELVLQVTVFLTHRNCPEGIKKTKFDTKGLKILKATKWTEKSSLTFVRKLKIKVEGSKDGKLTLTAIRTCDKEGGLGSIILNAAPVN